MELAIAAAGTVSDDLLAAFVADQQGRYDAYVSATTPEQVRRAQPTIPFLSAKVVAEKRSRFARILLREYYSSDQDGHKQGDILSGSVVCFVDLTNGDIHKGSAKGPVKNGRRGNVHEADRGERCMTARSVGYVR